MPQLVESCDMFYFIKSLPFSSLTQIFTLSLQAEKKDNHESTHSKYK